MFGRILYASGIFQHTVEVEHSAIANLLFALWSNCVPKNNKWIFLRLLKLPRMRQNIYPKIDQTSKN